MNHWMCDDKSPVLPLRDLRQMCDSRPPEPNGDYSLVIQKGSNYFLRIDPNNNLFRLICHKTKQNQYYEIRITDF